ncbi:hypothetical protein [Actinomadura rubrisoli]|uniref:Uncharacterized protein n=1 Tax=Actinomadura rubrisoli TaxID=2530368 RepID=A0A4R5C7R4_9ACTN|nr:hypothetical protein [Actinomadura rubrisoli]TDD94616.1 hypothetical protein E1298_06440 [Actinomadura rubrisoli]
MRIRTRGALAALPLVLALTLAGCGSDDGGDGKVASAGGAKQGGAAAAGKGMSQDEKGVKYAECMRKNGVPMEDPKPGGNIQLKLDKRTPKATLDKATQACKALDPMADGSGKQDPKQQEQGRKFAECMRQNGVEAFADPKPGQRGIMIDGKVAEDPDFKAAQQKCQEVLSGGGK